MFNPELLELIFQSGDGARDGDEPGVGFDDGGTRGCTRECSVGEDLGDSLIISGRKVIGPHEAARGGEITDGLA